MQAKRKGQIDNIDRTQIDIMYKTMTTKNAWCAVVITALAPVTPSSDATAFVQRSDNLSAGCGVARNVPNISNLPVTACTDRPYSFHTATFPSICTASMTSFMRARRCCSVFTAFSARSRRAYSVLTARIAFKVFKNIFSNLLLRL